MKKIKIWKFSIVALSIMLLLSELFKLYCGKYVQNISVSTDGFEKLALIVLGFLNIIFYAKFKEPVINIKVMKGKFKK